MSTSILKSVIEKQMKMVAETTAFAFYLYNELSNYTQQEKVISRTAINLRNYAIINSLEEPIHKIVQQLDRIKQIDYKAFYKELKDIGIERKHKNLISLALYYFKNGNSFFMSTETIAKTIYKIKGKKYSKEAIRTGLNDLVEHGILCRSERLKTKSVYIYYPTVKFINILQNVQKHCFLKRLSDSTGRSYTFEIDKTDWVFMLRKVPRVKDSKSVHFKRYEKFNAFRTVFKFYNTTGKLEMLKDASLKIKRNLELQAIDDLRTLAGKNPTCWADKELNLLKKIYLKFIAMPQATKLNLLKEKNVVLPETIANDPLMFTYGIFAGFGGQLSYTELQNMVEDTIVYKHKEPALSLLDCTFAPDTEVLHRDSTVFNATKYGTVNKSGVKSTEEYYQNHIEKRAPITHSNRFVNDDPEDYDDPAIQAEFELSMRQFADAYADGEEAGFMEARDTEAVKEDAQQAAVKKNSEPEKQAKVLSPVDKSCYSESVRNWRDLKGNQGITFACKDEVEKDEVDGLKVVNFYVKRFEVKKETGVNTGVTLPEKGKTSNKFTHAVGSNIIQLKRAARKKRQSAKVFLMGDFRK